jgi:aryl-alcohol dehydrogenase-like predicted oxidoreductase
MKRAVKMEYRYLGGSGLRISALSYGTGTFGGRGELFSKWGDSDAAEATRLVDLCIDAGINMFDTADVYSSGGSEEILGEALLGRRDRVLVSTKAAFGMSDDPNDIGSSRFHLMRACEASLRRMKTDYIDIYTIHNFDARTPVEETLRALDDLVQSGKVRYIACSNFSGWHLMKSLSVSDRHAWTRYVGHQAHYSLVAREYEWELMPLALDQKVGTLVWSPLSAGRLSGKFRRDQAPPEKSRITLGAGEGPPIPDDWFYNLIDVIDEVAAETEKTVAQVALNWLLQRPTISTVVVGARNETQLVENLGAAGWALTTDQMTRLDQASERDPIYPYWHQRYLPERNPAPLKYYK